MFTVTAQPAILSELLCILGAEGCVVDVNLLLPITAYSNPGLNMASLHTCARAPVYTTFACPPARLPRPRAPGRGPRARDGPGPGRSGPPALLRACARLPLGGRAASVPPRAAQSVGQLRSAGILLVTAAAIAAAEQGEAPPGSQYN